MDTTPKYILMCEKAEEIQHRPARNLSNVRWCLDTKFYTNIFDRMYSCKIYGRTGEEDIYLPRQDQLQEMVSDRPTDLGLQSLCAMIYGFSTSVMNGGVDITVDGSMEQLWLAFVMHEKYQKHWDEEKEEWVNA
jgi:hypothetical protein